MKTRLLPIIAILLVTCLMFFKFFTKGFVPVPGDLLVSFFFPFYSGGWEGYDPWTTHKEFLGSDAIRQIFLWKEFAFNHFKNGQIPLWNPYTFTGSPLAANFQSGIYYPLNVIFLFIESKSAWVVFIMIQPILIGTFMYSLLRSLKASQVASLFSAITLMFSSYIITWLENGNVIHAFLWLPLSFLAVNKYFENFKLRFLLLLMVSLTLSILAGHPQSAIYVVMAILPYWVYKSIHAKENLSRSIIYLIIAISAALLLTAIQVIPSFSLYLSSPLSLNFSKDIFDIFVFPYQNFVTFLAPDFFGHPASNNYWSRNYGDFTPYIGVLPLLLTLWAIIVLWKKPLTKFLSLTSLLFILAAIKSPISYLIQILEIPLIDSTSIARILAIPMFFFSILAGFGLQILLERINESKFRIKFIKFLLFIGVGYVILWIFATFAGSFLTPKDTWEINLAVSRRNLVLPSLMYLSLLFTIITIHVLHNLKIKINYYYLLATIIFLVTILGGLFYSNKFLPMSPKKYLFPSHPIFDWAKENGGINRIYGIDTAHIDANLPTHYEIYGVEGYDTLRLKRYAELVASSITGNVPSSYPRSDAEISKNENGNRNRILDLLGVKYYFDKIDDPKTGSDWRGYRFPGDDVSGVWQFNKFQIYERKNALPRFFMTSNFEVVKTDDQIIRKIYNEDFNLNTVILEKDPGIGKAANRESIIIPELLMYESNRVIFRTSNLQDSILFLSDAYTTDWKVTIDTRPAQLLRANYALRAVAVPMGEHLVTFDYQPISHKVGLVISTIAFILMGTIIVVVIKKNKF